MPKHAGGNTPCEAVFTDPWKDVPYINKEQGIGGKWSASSWKGCPPVKLNDRTNYETPMLALASHLEGVREAGMLDQYIEDLKEPTPKSKKTRDRKRGLHGVMKQMNAWKDSNKYESVRAVMTAVGAITRAPGPVVGNHASGDRSTKRQKGRRAPATLSTDLWKAVPYIRNSQSSDLTWIASEWKGCPPVKINDRTRWENPMLALASHLEGVREAGMLDQYIEELQVPIPQSKKTRDRKRGLHGVMKQMNAWKDSNKYESVRAVMTAVGAITSAPGPAVGTCNHAAGDRSSKRQKDSKRSSENGAVSEFV